MIKVPITQGSIEDFDVNRKNILYCIQYQYIYKKYFISFLILFLFINDFIIFKKYYERKIELILNAIKYKNVNNFTSKKNIDLIDEFLEIKEVKEQIYYNHLTYIETIMGGEGNIGNSLIALNNLINICEYIHCKNIIAPKGLERIIKRKIIYKEYNITIFPNSYKNIINIDIKLNKFTIFFFHYRNKKNNIRLRIIRDEVFNNIPKYIAKPNDLYINIRSGDIFVWAFNPNYSQPPLCFYLKIINENKFNNIFLLSNGHENPIVDELLKKYRKIHYIHGTIEEDISVIVNAFNFVLCVSTFPKTLIYLNNNLKNLYIYNISRYDLKNFNLININLITSITILIFGYI